MLTPEKIQENWERHVKIAEVYISEPRKQRVLQLLSELEEQLIVAPASIKDWYHNSFPGGYIDHVNRVVKCSFKVKDMWEELGATIDFTDEELVISALFHDIGKIGDGISENYKVQTDNWRKEKLKENYTNNPKLDFMLAQDRSIFILQKFGIPLNVKEFLAIRTHDGVYDDANKPYFFSNNPDSKFKTNLVYILHQADFMSAKIEYNLWQKTVEKV